MTGGRPGRPGEHDRDRFDEEFLLVWMRRGRDRDEDSEDGRGDGDGGEGGGGQGGSPGPTATPFLVIPSAQGDTGARPVPVAQAVANMSVQATVTGVIEVVNYYQYRIQLSCVVANLGVAPCAGLAEFYVGGQFALWNPGHEALTPAQVRADAELIGYATFTAPPGGTVTVTCPVLWTPVVIEPHPGLAEAEKGVLVQVYDAITDRMTAPFDAVNDRHVARNDEVMDPILF